MPSVTLLSNGGYRVAVTAGGSGRSQWNDLAVTRWRADTVFDDCGTFLFVRDAADSAPLPAPCPP